MRGPLGILFLTLFVAIVGLSILFPVMAPLGRELGLREHEIGLVSSAYALMQLLCAPFWGRLSERLGRKRVMAIGLCGFIVGYVVLGVVVELGRAGVLAHTPLVASMFCARLLGGALSSALLPTAQAYAADVTPPEKRTQGMAVMGGAFGLGIIVGPGLGAGLAALFGLVAPLWGSAVLASIDLVLVLTFLPEAPRREARASGHASSLARRVAPFLVIGLTTTMATVLVEQTIAFSYQDLLGLRPVETPEVVGIALGIYGTTAVLTQGFIARRAGLTPRTLLLVGAPLTLLSMVGLSLATDFTTLTLSLVLQALGQGLVLPGVTATLSLTASDHEQGEVMGLHGSAQGIGRFLGPLVGPTLYGIARPLPYELGAFLLGVVLTVVVVMRRRVAPEPRPT